MLCSSLVRLKCTDVIIMFLGWLNGNLTTIYQIRWCKGVRDPTFIIKHICQRSEADLNVLTMSVNNLDGSSQRLVNLRNACKNDATVKLSVSSRWIASWRTSEQTAIGLSSLTSRWVVNKQWTSKIYACVKMVVLRRRDQLKGQVVELL